MLKKTVFILSAIALLLTGCGSEVNLNEFTATPSAIVDEPSATAPAPEPTLEALKPDKGYTRIKEIPKAREVNTLMLNKVEAEAVKEVDTVYEGTATIRSHLVASGNVLYFGDFDGKFSALDTTSNEILWTYDAGERIICKPVIEGNKILFNVKNALFCLDIQTGKEIWKFTREVDPSVKGVTGANYDYREYEAVIYNGAVYYPSNDGSLTAVDLETGKEVWRNVSEYPVPVSSSLVVYKDKLYYNSLMGDLYCLDLKTHKQIFRLSHGDPVQASMLIADDVAYFAGRTCKAFAVDVNTGKVLWVTQVPTRYSWYSGGVLMVGEDLYFGTSDEYNMVVLDKQTGAFKKMYRTDHNVFTDSIVYGDQLIVTDCDVRAKVYGTIQAYDLNTENRKLWEVELDSGVLSSQVIIGDSVYFGTENGKIYRVNLK